METFTPLVRHTRALYGTRASHSLRYKSHSLICFTRALLFCAFMFLFVRLHLEPPNAYLVSVYRLVRQNIHSVILYLNVFLDFMSHEGYTITI